MKNVFITSIGFSIIISFVLSNCNPSHTAPSPMRFLIKGSDTEYGLVKDLCAAFNKQLHNDSISFDISGGGTSTGFRALINNETDLANASREATDKEEQLLKKNGIETLRVMFATDAIAIITHPELGVDSLSLDELSGIFTGRITNWKQVDGPDLKINIHSRNYLSGTYFYFKEKIIRGEFKTDVWFYESNADIVEAVTRDRGGIGYVGSGFLMDREGKPSRQIWAMPIHIDEQHSAVSPYQVELVKQGEYPLTRPLYQYLKKPFHASLEQLVLFELSGSGQEIIRSHGYFPINDYQKEINTLKGLNF